MADESKSTLQPTESSAELNVQDDEKEVQDTEEQGNREETQYLQISQSQKTYAEVSAYAHSPKKGKSLQEAKLNDFQRFYKKWKYHINSFKKMVKNKGIDLIPEAVSAIDTIATDICNIYDEIRKIESPDLEIKRRCDVCCAVSDTARTKAQCLLEENGDPDSIPWPDSESVFESSSSSTSSGITFKSKSMAGMSHQSSVVSLQQRQEAAAEVAATEEVIKIMKTQHQCEEEIRKLEVEDAKKRAQFLTESTTIKTKLEEKKKEVELLKELQKRNAAQGRLKVYAESINSKDEESPPVVHLQVKQVSSLQQSKFPNVHSKPFIPPHVKAHKSQQSAQQTEILTANEEASIDLVKTLAEAITANRIQTPEPAVFTGDPLQYNDWKLSFQTLVDRKNLPVQEKLFFLRKYVGGSAKKAIEGHFLAGTDVAYCAA